MDTVFLCSACVSHTDECLKLCTLRSSEQITVYSHLEQIRHLVHDSLLIAEHYHLCNSTSIFVITHRSDCLSTYSSLVRKKH